MQERSNLTLSSGKSGSMDSRQGFRAISWEGPRVTLDTAPSITIQMRGVGMISNSVTACLWNGISSGRTSGSVGKGKSMFIM